MISVRYRHTVVCILAHLKLCILMISVFCRLLGVYCLLGQNWLWCLPAPLVESCIPGAAWFSVDIWIMKENYISYLGENSKHFCPPNPPNVCTHKRCFFLKNRAWMVLEVLKFHCSREDFNNAILMLNVDEIKEFVWNIFVVTQTKKENVPCIPVQYFNVVPAFFVW